MSMMPEGPKPDQWIWKMFKTTILPLLLIVLVLGPSSHAQENTPIEDDYENPTSNWRFIISPYAWLAGQATDVGAKKSGNHSTTSSP